MTRDCAHGLIAWLATGSEVPGCRSRGRHSAAAGRRHPDRAALVWTTGGRAWSLPLPGRRRHAGSDAAAEVRAAARTRQGTILKYTVRTTDGRRLSTQVSGDPDGRPVFLLHGTPGSRLGPHPRSAVLHRLGVRLISFDRPGYGGSDRLAGRRVADAAADVLAIADAYGLEKFSVVGRSGGGPHALACAALLPERTTKAAVLVGLAPHGADGLDWFDGMAQSNVIEFTAAANGYEDIVAHTKAVAERGPGQPGQPDRQAPGRTARPRTGGWWRIGASGRC